MNDDGSGGIGMGGEFLVAIMIMMMMMTVVGRRRKKCTSYVGMELNGTHDSISTQSFSCTQ